MLNDSDRPATFTNILLYRKPLPTHVLCFTIATFIWMGWPAKSTKAQQITPEVARFVGEVVVGREYETENHVAMKWDTNPRLSVFGADVEQTRIIRHTVRKINEAMEPTEIQIEIVEPEDRMATLRVYFAPLDDFAEIVEREEITYIEGNLGYFYMRWNQAFIIESGVVLLASDRLRGAELKHIAMEEVTQSLGLPGDSPRFESSLFYEDMASRNYGTAKTLSRLDAKLLRFLYQKVEPGMHAVELGILMAKHWADAK